MKKIALTLMALAIVSIYGCGPNKLYYYGSYSNTLYEYRKDANQETLARHMKELENIIAESKEEGKRVPPGLYGELGYLHMKSNDNVKAVNFFNLEKQIYPESTILIDRLIKQTNKDS